MLDEFLSNIDRGFGHLHEPALDDITSIRVGFVFLAADALLAGEDAEAFLNGFDSGQNPVESLRRKSVGGHPLRRR